MAQTQRKMPSRLLMLCAWQVRFLVERGAEFSSEPDEWGTPGVGGYLGVGRGHWMVNGIPCWKATMIGVAV